MEAFCKKTILKSFVKFTRKHLRRSLFLVNLEVGDKKLYYKGGCSKDIFLSILRNFWEQLFCNFCMGLQTHLKSSCYVGGASDSWYMIDCAAQNSQTLNMIFWKRVVAAIFSLSRATTPLSLLWLSRFSFFSVKQKLVSGFFNTVFFKFNFFLSYLYSAGCYKKNWNCFWKSIST